LLAQQKHPGLSSALTWGSSRRETNTWEARALLRAQREVRHLRFEFLQESGGEGPAGENGAQPAAAVAEIPPPPPPLLGRPDPARPTTTAAVLLPPAVKPLRQRQRRSCCRAGSAAGLSPRPARPGSPTTSLIRCAWHGGGRGGACLHISPASQAQRYICRCRRAGPAAGLSPRPARVYCVTMQLCYYL
jgi:hypothetical protein